MVYLLEFEESWPACGTGLSPNFLKTSVSNVLFKFLQEPFFKVLDLPLLPDFDDSKELLYSANKLSIMALF